MILILYGRSGTVKNIKFKEDVCTMYNGLNRIQKACYFKNTDTFIRQDNMGEKIKIDTRTAEYVSRAKDA